MRDSSESSIKYHTLDFTLFRAFLCFSYSVVFGFRRLFVFFHRLISDVARLVCAERETADSENYSASHFARAAPPRIVRMFAQGRR